MYIWKSLLQYTPFLILLFCCYFIEICNKAFVKFPSYCIMSTMLFTVKLFWKKMIKDHWFIIYAMIHVFNWKMCLLDHSKIIHPLFSPSLIWQLDLNNTSKQMALEAKKIVQRWNRDFGNFDSSYCTLLLKNCPSTYFVNNSLIRRERYIYLIYIFKLQSFEIYMGVGVCVRACARVCTCIYIYIIDR